MSKFLWSLGSGLLLTFSVFSTGVASAAKTDGAPQARSVAEHTSADASILPRAQASFQGKIGRTYKDSEPDWSRPVQAPVGAPNVLLVLTDDVGFGASSTFGGLVPTPNLDQLADNGVRYNRFHTTAICSPTRASLLTGRNHHAVGVGIVADLAAGYPGYDGYMPRSAATVAEVLKLNGYNTAMFGKHHNVPAGASSTAGPFDQWPVGLGFEYFYGFVGAQANQFSPPLYRGTNPIEAPEGVMLDQALIDDAINWVHNQRASAPEKPFFIYYAPGTAHAPHQAPREWIEKFRGRFDEGWDQARAETFERQKKLGVVPPDAELTPRPEGIPAWDSISEAHKTVTARMMEVYAAMLSYQDYQFGRLVDELERMGELDNTLVLFIQGDNGGSAEGTLFGHTNPMGGFANAAEETVEEQLAKLDEMGGPNTAQNVAAGWTWVANTPFKWTKQIASHLGGIRNGLVVSWPERIKARGVRPQFHHVVDIMPTILEAAGLPQPTEVYGVQQQRVDGVSMVYSFEDTKAPGQRRMQYFETLGNRAIYKDGWMASTRPTRATWMMNEPLYVVDSPEDYEWELYHLDEDFSQARDLAQAHPERLEALKAAFAEEAERNQVYPLDDRLTMPRFAAADEGGAPPRSRYVYWGKDITVPAEMAPNFVGSFTLTAEIETESGSADGVLAALGSHFAGWSFYLKDGRPTVVMAGSQQAERTFRVQAEISVPTGAATVEYRFESDGPGQGGLMHISIDGREVAQGRIEKTILRTVEMTDTFDIGLDRSTPVTDDYQDQGRFTGQIHKLTVASASAR